jgi:hypothetical protein
MLGAKGLITINKRAPPRRYFWIDLVSSTKVARMFARRPQHFARFVALVAAAILLTRAIVPAGYMWAPTGSGAAVVLCTDHGAISVPAAPGKPEGPRSHDSGVCPFAASADGGAPSLTQPSVLTHQIVLDAGARFAFSTTRPGIAAPPPPPTGPPALV